MQTAIKKMGNSAGFILPRAALSHLNVSVGDLIDINLEQGRLVLSPARAHPRAGWAQAAQELAASGDDGADWPLLTNIGDEAL